MWEFTHEETIDAPVEQVFNLLTDLPSYQNWNPFLIKAKGYHDHHGKVASRPRPRLIPCQMTFDWQLDFSIETFQVQPVLASGKDSI